MSTIIVSGMWHCQECGDSGPVEPVEPGESIYADHQCGGDYYPEEERW
jgi:hypothetical protein